MKQVLFIGCGGLGCKVASNIRMMVMGTGDQNRTDGAADIHFLGFDSEPVWNIDSVIIDRKGINERLQNRESVWHEWFSDKKMLEINRKHKIMEQLRKSNQLAFADTMRCPDAIQKLEEALRYLQRETGEPNEGLKVMIVSSIAGSFGSAMFLQFPVLLRKIFRERFPEVKIQIHGLTALPDIFADFAINPAQKEAFYSNAYAALQELADFTGNDHSDDNDLVSAYSQGRNDIPSSNKSPNSDGFPEGGEIIARGIVYDTLLFVNNINSEKKILNDSFNELVNKMAKIAFTRVYGPISEAIASCADSRIIERVMAGRRGTVFGSAGFSKIIYPYEDILRCLACRMMEDTISSQWTVFDKAYREMVKVLKEKQDNDVPMQIPTLGSYIIWEVNKKLGENSRKFKFLRDGCTETIIEEVSSGEESRQIKKLEKKYTLFENKVHEYVESVYNDDTLLTTMADDAVFYNDPSDKTKDSVAYHVSEIEERLRSYYESVDERINALCSSTADSIFPEIFGGRNDDLSHMYNIRNLLEKTNDGKRSSVHPLAARYLLYALCKSLEDKQKELEGTWEIEKEKIRSYWAKDRNPRTEYLIEDWAEVVPSTLRFHSLSAFKKQYAAESSTQRFRIKDYGKDKFKWLVYEKVIDRINALLQQYEKVFGAMEYVEKAMLTQRKQLERQFKSSSGSEIYLGTSEETLDKAYRYLRSDYTSAELGDVYSELLKMAYSNAVKEEQDILKPAEEKTIQNDNICQSVAAIFTEKGLPEYIRQLDIEDSDELRMDVFKVLEKQAAINAEAKMEGSQKDIQPNPEDIARECRELIALAFQKAAPNLWISSSHDSDGTYGDNLYRDCFWGMSSYLPDSEMRNYAVDQMRQIGDGFSDIISDRLYSKYELICYRTVTGFRLV